MVSFLQKIRWAFKYLFCDKPLTEEEFATFCKEGFSFLVDEYQFQISDINALGTMGYITKFYSARIVIVITYECREREVVLSICKRNSQPIEDIQGYGTGCYQFEDIVKQFMPDKYSIPVEIRYSNEPEHSRGIIKHCATLLHKYRHEILTGTSAFFG
ncbi:MAG: hypothetical protein BWY76_00916 [bacterium ADurb.Bin429]|nr:MAG: hypothetical protein BWY76_00916 [bacterium ADurb.Bin429]